MSKEIHQFKTFLTNLLHMDQAHFALSEDFLQIEKIARGNFVVREGEVCKKIAFVSEGLFRVFSQKEGVEINSCFCLENSVTCSFNSFIGQIPSIEFIQALEESTIVTLSYNALNQLVLQSRQWQTVRQLLTERECSRLTDRANTLSFETALEKYSNLLQYQPELIKRVAVQHLASYLGVSRETLSRIRSKIG